MEFEGHAFISYAHLDNVELVEGRKGWVANLHRALEVRVGQLLGKKPEIWRDPKLNGNDILEDALFERLRHVAVLISVVSPRYVRSEWSLRELSEFVKAVRQQDGLSVQEKARVFKVLKTPVPRDRIPAELQSLLGYEFFKVDSETGRIRELDEVFGPEAQRDFWIKLDDLAHDICGLIERLEASGEPTASSPPVQVEHVFLAETTSDLKDQRAALKRDLQQSGYTVLPDRALPLVAQEVTASVREEFFYAKCGCYQGLAAAIPQAFDANTPGLGPGVLKDLNFQQLYLDAEYAPNGHYSFFAEIPERWIQPQALLTFPPFAPLANQAGLGDIRAGVKGAILSNHWSVEPALLYLQQLSDRLAIESQISDWLPIGGSAGVPTSSSGMFSGNVLSYGVGPSDEIYRSGRIRLAPVVELVGWNIRSGFETLPGGPVLGVAADASGTNIVNLKIGARIVERGGSSFYVGYGRALTPVWWYKDIVRLEYRYSF